MQQFANGGVGPPSAPHEYIHSRLRGFVDTAAKTTQLHSARVLYSLGTSSEQA